MKILIVEDECLIAMMLVDALMDAGHQVLGPAQTAGEALKIARAVKPDLVLSNINLADDVKGTDLARILRAEFDIPVIFVSGNIHEARAARDAGLGYISKPCSPTLVQESVEFARTLIDGVPLNAERAPPGLTLFQGIDR